MGGPAANPYAANRHADVLNEEPTDIDGKMRLVEEVKHRAKGAFMQKDMPSAEALYSKVISLLDSIPGKSETAAFSNRSMVRLNLNKVEDALADANRCLEIDGKFVKAWHRKAQALLRLSEWDKAINAAEEGAKLDPANKAFSEIIENAKKDREKNVEDKAKLRRDAQDVRVELHNASTARSPVVKKDTQNDEQDSGMRGYKVRADGKVTSYFHTDISDEAKALIEAQGFGKPQQIENEEVPAADVRGGGSKWNQAGTYEEKGMSKWVEQELKTRLIGIQFDVPTGSGGVIKTIEVSNVTGDASISVSRGKRRHLLDVSFDLGFEGKVGESTGGGKLVFDEVTTDDEPGVKMEVNSDVSPALREVFNAFVKPAGQGLQSLVLSQVKNLTEEYKTK